MDISCYCCKKEQTSALPRKCPECGHIFQGQGWGGIDAHWKSKHDDVISYADFWSSLCKNHKP